MKLVPKSKLMGRIVAAAVVLAVAYFFYVVLADNWQAAQSVDLRFDFLHLVAMLLFALAVVASGQIWGMLLNSLAVPKKIGIAESVRVHIGSWLLKYVPSQAGSVINKVTWAEKNDFGKKLVFITVVYENIFLLTASFLIGLPLIPILLGTELSPWYLLLAVAAGLALMVLLRRRILHKITGTLFTKTIKQPVAEDSFLQNKKAAYFQLLYLLPRLINGLGFALVAGSLIALSAPSYLFFAAAYIVAGAVGIMAVFVPSGIGVREAVLVALTAVIIPVEQAVVVALVARLYATLADVILAALYAVLTTIKKRGVQL